MGNGTTKSTYVSTGMSKRIGEEIVLHRNTDSKTTPCIPIHTLKTQKKISFDRKEEKKGEGGLTFTTVCHLRNQGLYLRSVTPTRVGGRSQQDNTIQPFYMSSNRIRDCVNSLNHKLFYYLNLFFLF